MLGLVRITHCGGLLNGRARRGRTPPEVQGRSAPSRVHRSLRTPLKGLPSDLTSMKRPSFVLRFT